MDWNRIPDDSKKLMIQFTGGFRFHHESLFRGVLRSIERRSSDFVCYICGLQNSFLRCGLSRNPSTRMYVKKNQMSVEVFGKCTKHNGGPLSVDEEGIILPRSVETDEEIMEFLEPMFPGSHKVFMFTTDEDSHSSWKVIEVNDHDRTSVRSRSCGALL